ncbi:hypothetical protein [Methanoregula sp.]|jgi:hypothetical protein|uniref:hypothetical protein n=1 Tax=Methanoregula sp. TaxID=2052170 RepID=UPI002623FEFE|nr:hypothetical protein [Methanoregula sp.]MDD5141961.1 hypothetical protein [Methanoregula sp.]
MNEFINDITTASYSKSSNGMVDSTGVQIINPFNSFNQSTSSKIIMPIISIPMWSIGQKQEEKKTFKFDWAGGLSDLKGKVNSVELTHEALKWR